MNQLARAIGVWIRQRYRMYYRDKWIWVAKILVYAPGGDLASTGPVSVTKDGRDSVPGLTWKGGAATSTLKRFYC
jgi:hypothetical protein